MFSVAVGHTSSSSHHQSITSVPQCLCSRWADARMRPPELHPKSLQGPPQGSLYPPEEEEDGQAQVLSHPRGASRSRSGISAGSGRNVVAAGTMPAPCTGHLRDSPGAAAQAQPCSQGAGRKQMEMTLASISCGRTRRQDFLQHCSPCQPSRALGTTAITEGSQRCVPHTGTSTLWHPVPPHCPPGATGLQCQHTRSSTSRNQHDGIPCHCPQLCPARCWSAWGRIHPSAAPGARLELQAGLCDSEGLCEGRQAHPMQPPGLAQRRFIWNEQFPNKLCNLKILRKKAGGRGACGSSASAWGLQG